MGGDKIKYLGNKRVFFMVQILHEKLIQQQGNLFASGCVGSQLAPTKSFYLVQLQMSESLDFFVVIFEGLLQEPFGGKISELYENLGNNTILNIPNRLNHILSVIWQLRYLGEGFQHDRL